MSDEKTPAAPAPDDGRRWDDLRLVAVRLVDEAQRAGAHHAEVLLRRRCRRAVEDRGPVVGPLWDDRVVVRATDRDGRVGTASGPWARVEGVVKEAVESIDGSPDPLQRPVRRMDITDRGLGIDDPRLPAVTDADRRATVDDNLAGVANINRTLKVRGLAYYEEREERAFASSAEVSAAEAATRFSIQGTVATAGGGTVVDGMIASRAFAEVASRPLGVDLARLCQALARPTTMPDSLRHVAFGQRAVARLLEGLAPAFSAEAIAEGRSFLAGRVGQRIASPEVHVLDNALRMGGLGARGFDDRGTPPVEVPLIREGVAGGVYQDPRTARRHDVRPTGHARADDSLWTGNLVVRSGNRTRNMLFPDLGTFVLVEDILDVSGIDPASGRIEVAVQLLVHDGTESLGNPGPMVMVTTADDILQNVESVVSDQERHGLVDTGTWIVASGLGFRPA